MNVAMCAYASVAVLISLIGQASGASIPSLRIEGMLPAVSLKDIPTSTLPSELTTEDITTPLYTAESELTTTLDPLEEQVDQHQFAIKWFRAYQYLPQDHSIACESCQPKLCAEECLPTLQELVTEPLIEFQEFYNFEQTGVLSLKEISQMKEPRCGDTDEKQNEGKGSRKKRWAKLGSTLWPAEMMPLTISVNRGTRGFSVQDVETIALECARMWAEPSSLYFQLGAAGSKGNIDIRFEHIDGQWNTVGLGLSPVIWGDKSSYLKLDSAETWKRDTLAPGYGVSLKWAICHEMGHNLGLSHSSDSSAIMYPSGIGQNEEQLPRDDYTGITSLYRGRNGKTVFGRQPKAAPRPPVQPTTRQTVRPVHRQPIRPTHRPTHRNTPRHRTPPRPTPRSTTRRPQTWAPSTRAPTVRRHPPTRRPVTTRRPTQRRTFTTRRPPTRPPPTRHPTVATRYRHTTPYRQYKSPNERRFAPPGYKRRYRPAPTPAPTQAPVEYWYFDSIENRWMYGTTA